MNHGGDKLHLLLHTLGERFHLLIAPFGEVEAVEPVEHLSGGICLAHALQTCQIHNLVAHLHLLVQPTLFGQIANVRHIVGGDGAAVEHHRAAIGGGDHVDDANEGGLACAIRAKQTVDAAFGHSQVHMVERRVPFILLHYIADFNKSHILEI